MIQLARMKEEQRERTGRSLSEPEREPERAYFPYIEVTNGINRFLLFFCPEACLLSTMPQAHFVWVFTQLNRLLESRGRRPLAQVWGRGALSVPFLCFLSSLSIPVDNSRNFVENPGITFSACAYNPWGIWVLVFHRV